MIRRFGFLIAVGLSFALFGNEDAAPVRFSEHLVADKYAYSFGLTATDLDGDGDLDLTSVDIRGKPSLSELLWFENDGKGAFTRHVIARDEPGWFERHAAEDIDGDKKPDIAVVNNRDGHVLWFANSDQPRKLWKRHVITTKAPRAYDVVVIDLDGDGRRDAAVAGYASNVISWYRNPGKAGWDGEWERYVVGEKMTEARMIRAGDVNGDGKIDLVCAAVGVENLPADVTDAERHGSRVVWYENPGAGVRQPWQRHVIDEKSRAPIHGHLADMDGDGDLDVVLAFGMRAALIPEDRHEVAWYENVGKGTKWQRHRIGPLPCAFEAFAADLDGDGDLDVAATAWAKGDRLVWFENGGDPRRGWKMHTLKEKWYAANQVIAADLNGDKRLDLAGTADNGSSRVVGANELRWWRNEGRK